MKWNKAKRKNRINSNLISMDEDDFSFDDFFQDCLNSFDFHYNCVCTPEIQKKVFFSIFNEILSIFTEKIEKSQNGIYFYFKTPFLNPFKKKMTYKHRCGMNFLIEYSGILPTIKDLEELNIELESEINELLEENMEFTLKLKRKLQQWIMARITNKLFYFSQQAYLDPKYLEKEVNEYESFSNYFNVLAGFPWCGGKIWFIILFELCFNTLKPLIESLEVRDDSLIQIDPIIEEKYIRMIEFGFPILISNTDILLMREFSKIDSIIYGKQDYDPKTRRFSTSYPEWFPSIYKLTNEWEYYYSQVGYLPVREKKYNKKYPFYHCIIRSKYQIDLFDEY